MYIFKKWVMDLVVRDREIESIRGHLIPVLLNCQHRPDYLKRMGIDKMLVAARDLLAPAHLMSTSGIASNNEVLCIALVQKEGSTARVNTVASYIHVNRLLVKSVDESERVSASAEINSKTQIGTDSMVGQGTIIDERCSVKKSIIGKHCIIGKNVKISNSIVMDYCHIEEGVKIDGAVLCNRARIGARCHIKDAEIGGGCIVPCDTTLKSESLVE